MAQLPGAGRQPGARRTPERLTGRQGYGPLHWPRTGHEVLDVQARAARLLEGREPGRVRRARLGVGASVGGDRPSPASTRNPARWTQTLHVTLRAMKTINVIAAGVADSRSTFPAPVAGPATGLGWPPASSAQATATRYRATTRIRPRHSSSRPGTTTRGAPDPLPDADLSPRRPGAEPQPRCRVPAVRAHRVRSTIAGVPPRPIRRGWSSTLHTPGPRRWHTAWPRRGDAVRLRRAAERYLARVPLRREPAAPAYPFETFLFKTVRLLPAVRGAMALLLRMGGVPARVAAGFTAGSTARDARVGGGRHRCPRLGRGVVPALRLGGFDPTPAAAPARGGTCRRSGAPTPGAGPSGRPRPRVAWRSRAPAAARRPPHARRRHSRSLIVAGRSARAVRSCCWRWRGRPAAPPDGDDCWPSSSGRSPLRAPVGPETTLRRAGAALRGLGGRGRLHPGAPAGAIRRRRHTLPRPQRRALRAQLRRRARARRRLLRALWALPPRAATSGDCASKRRAAGLH